jgi:hypothetical protein
MEFLTGLCNLVGHSVKGSVYGEWKSCIFITKDHGSFLEIRYTIHIHESGVFFGLPACVKSSHWQHLLEYLHALRFI